MAVSAHRALQNALLKKFPKDGTALSGFVTEEENHPPRQCSNCRHMKDGTCRHPLVNADPELQGNKKGGFVQVDGCDCCDSFQNKR